jgi:hypothetical protein
MNTNLDLTNRNTSLPVDWLSFTRIPTATWLTQMVVAGKWAEALWRQTVMINGVMRGASETLAASRSSELR